MNKKGFLLLVLSLLIVTQVLVSVGGQEQKTVTCTTKTFPPEIISVTEDKIAEYQNKGYTCFSPPDPLPEEKVARACYRCEDVARNFAPIKFVLDDSTKCENNFAFPVPNISTSRECLVLIEVDLKLDSIKSEADECTKLAIAEGRRWLKGFDGKPFANRIFNIGFQRLDKWTDSYDCDELGRTLYQVKVPRAVDVYTTRSTKLNNPILGDITLFHDIKETQRDVSVANEEIIIDSYVVVNDEFVKLPDIFVSTNIVNFGRLNDEEEAQISLALSNYVAKNFASEGELALTGPSLIPAEGEIREARYGGTTDTGIFSDINVWTRRLLFPDRLVWYDENKNVLTEINGAYYKLKGIKVVQENEGGFFSVENNLGQGLRKDEKGFYELANPLDALLF